jgi:hypothetical protein
VNAPQERAEPLDPHPRAIVEFLSAVLADPWPSMSNQFCTYFEHLGCELKPADDHNDDDALLGVTRGSFETRRITTKNASWMAMDGSLFSLNFFAYEHERDVVAAVKAGYDGIRTGLIRLCGPPLDERLSLHDNRSAVWLVRDTEIELYAHIALAPVLQIGLSHKERNAVYESRLARLPDRPTS